MWVARRFLDDGVLLLRLETGIHQREAIGLYERMGFQRISTVPALPGGPAQPVL